MHRLTGSSQQTRARARRHETASRLLKYSLRGVEGGAQTPLGKEPPQENLGKWRLQVAQGFVEDSGLVYFNSLLGTGIARQPINSQPNQPFAKRGATPPALWRERGGNSG
jgi:hypothetical protein